MSENVSTEKSGKKAAATSVKAKLARHTLRALGRKKKKAKLADAAASKAFFEAKSKRSTDKQSAFRKKKRKK